MTEGQNRHHALIAEHVEDVLVDAYFPDVPGFGRGKVRDHYDLGNDRIVMVTTDRQSAFDQVLTAVPFKGQVLNACARFWFDATRDLLPNHVLADPDPNVTVAKKLKMLPLEVVVRDYLTGSTSTSIWSLYQLGNRSPYGVVLPDGMRKNQKLDHTVLTPTTKGDMGAHDVPIAPGDVVSTGLLSAKAWAEVEEAARALFARGREIAAKNGLILVDTKYEFGYDEKGQLVIADEIHTPDSSRYWRAGSYAERFSMGEEPDSLDKEFLRLWITARCDPYKGKIPPIPKDTLVDFSARYIALYEAISGKAYEPVVTVGCTIRERVHAAIRKLL